MKRKPVDMNKKVVSQLQSESGASQTPTPLGTDGPSDKSKIDDTLQTERPGAKASNELSAIIAQIAESHAAVADAVMETVTNAAKCGLMLLGVKGDVLKEGEFENWFKASGLPFSRMTRCKYMRLSARICEEAGCKPGLLLTVARSENGADPTFECDESRLKVTVAKAAGGRSLLELYIAWGIVRGSKTKSKEETEGQSPDPVASQQRAYRTWTAFCDLIPTVFPQLPPQEQTDIVTGLKQLLSQLKQLQSSQTVSQLRAA